METERQGQGKIDRLAFATREELNCRLLDGQHRGEILTWLNGLAEMRGVLDRYFGGKDVTEQNLSDYALSRKFAVWRERRERLTSLKTLGEFALRIGQSLEGAGLADGAAAMAGGTILELMEAAAGNPVEALPLVDAISSLRAGDHKARELEIKQEAQRQKAEDLRLKAEAQALAREKFERQTVEMFLKWAKSPEAQAILASRKSAAVQMEMLHKLMFEGEGGGDGGEA